MVANYLAIFSTVIEWQIMNNTLLKYMASKLSLRRWQSLALRKLDDMRGLDFISVIRAEDVGLDPARSFRSSPSGNIHLYNVFRKLHITPSDRIIDIGCGKGSAMRTMLRFPFELVSGIELSDQIGRIALMNFKLLRERRAEIHVCNAETFLSYEHFNIFYLYNPFPDDVMDVVIARIMNVRRNHASETTIIYNNPTCHSVLLNHGLFHLASYPDEWGNGISVYSNLPFVRSRLNYRSTQSQSLYAIF